MEKTVFKLTIIISLACFCIGCNNGKEMFTLLDSSQTNILFNNQIIENDSVNIIDFSNVYNGGGVGIGDFNNDGLQDIYFTGNVVPNKLYLNKGNMKFEDATEAAGVNGNGKWCRGVSVVDINNDGLMDMYVCASISRDAGKRENLLYINEGLSKNGVPHFKEMAKEYGLNDSSYSTMAAFFDYDNDGDLDVYVAVNEITANDNPNIFRKTSTDGSFRSSGKLFRNDSNDSLNHPFFTNVTKQTGTGIEGYSHAVTIADINNDGWKDIYVTNDYLSSNILYINNHDGTFTDRAKEYFKHTSANAMGQDIIDINNDGLPDVVELDMNPRDNFRKKMFLNPDNYRMYQNIELFGYQYQYVRNTLQLNQGPRVNSNDSIGAPIFSEIGFMSDVAETDWSWTPLVTDFDNDGYRDIIVTNGFPKDITDHDFAVFHQKAARLLTKKELLEEIPEVKINNYAFHNNGNLSFNDVSAAWGISSPSYSNGAAYADLDNDGDMDYVVNNINDNAFVYRNDLNNGEKQNNFLYINFKGDTLNKNGIGAIAQLHYSNGKTQVYENTPYRGYLSSMQAGAHFGTGKIATIDSVIIQWPNGKMQLLQQVKTNQVLNVEIKQATANYHFEQDALATNSWFTEISKSLDVNYIHHDRDFIDFNIQRLLPHKFSEYGPGLAVGDIDKNGLDDIVITGAKNYSSQFLLQQPDGKFLQKPLLTNEAEKQSEDLGVLLFDADNDGDDDLYIAAGSNESGHSNNAYADKLYINDGSGNFAQDTHALPQNFTSKFCVRAADYDKDGDLDLFIAGRVDPGNYPKPVSSFVYRNDTKNGVIKFTDVTATVAKDLINIGLICDAVFSDFNNDGWTDLILAGEWMPITFLKNDKGTFKNVTSTSGISKYLGWWTTITPGDFDNDGDIDYVVGNLGENTFYKASEQYPVSIYANDFDKNGVMECIPTKYLKDKDGVLKEFTVHTRDDVVDGMPFIKKRFLTYKTFAEASFDKLFTAEELKGVLKLQANYFKSAFIKNNGKGSFAISALPAVAQFSSLNGMVADDFDGDNNLDIAINTNDYGTEVSTGRYDALNGLLLKGNGDGTFTPLSILQSGIYIPGNGKALVKLLGSSGNYLVAASQNKGALKLFELKRKVKVVQINPSEVSALIKFKNGKTEKIEFYYGASFLSQSARFVNINENVLSVTILDNNGDRRVIQF
jgi:hypothetical protein